MTGVAPDRPSDQMAGADVANGEADVLDQGFEEQQGGRPAQVDPAHSGNGRDEDPTDDATDDDSTDDHATDDSR
jgi:hypothetical protein